MDTESRLRALEEALQDPLGFLRARDLIGELGELLRNHRWFDDPRLAHVEAVLLALIEHPAWQVRHGVARALEHFRDPAFERASRVLLSDGHAAVRRAIEEAVSQRTARRDPVRGDHDALWGVYLEDLAARHGPRAAEQARRVGERFAYRLLSEQYHEVQGLVTAAELAIDTARATLLTPEAAQASLAEAKRALAQLASVVESFREYVREVPLDFRPVSLADAVRTAAEQVSPRRRTRPFQVDVRCASPVVVEADSKRLIQAFSNVLRNARESYPARRQPRATVEVRLDDHGGGATLTFRDEGQGMSADDLHRVAHGVASRKKGGLGFGVRLTRRIIENEHGGRLQLASTVGQGTTVTISLPLRQEKV